MLKASNKNLENFEVGLKLGDDLNEGAPVIISEIGQIITKRPEVVTGANLHCVVYMFINRTECTRFAHACINQVKRTQLRWWKYN